MRKLLIGCALGALVVAVSACGGSGGTPASEKALQRQADIYEISQIEKSFHESMSKKDIAEMMSLWAPNATFTYGPGQTATGTAQIRKTWLGSPSFEPTTHWARCTSSATSSTSTRERWRPSREATSMSRGSTAAG
jgi:SnoaL-like protein